MNTRKTKNNRHTSFGVFLMLLIAFVGILAVSTPGSAHVCKSEDHAACGSHDCPDDGDVHTHRHNVHWWRDHGCTSKPSCEAIGGVIADRGPGNVAGTVGNVAGRVDMNSPWESDNRACSAGLYQPDPYDIVGVDPLE